MRKLISFLLTLMLAAVCVSGQPLSFDQLLQMKAAGISDAMLISEARQYGLDFIITDKMRKSLKEVGVDDIAILRLKKEGTPSCSTPEDVRSLVNRGYSPGTVIELIASRDNPPVIDQATTLHWIRNNINSLVISAAAGTPVKPVQLLLWKKQGIEEDALISLLNYVGLEEPLSETQLKQLAASPKLLAAVRTASGPRSPRGWNIFRHPSHVYAIPYPPGWHVFQEIDEGAIYTAFTPQADMHRVEDAGTGFFMCFAQYVPEHHPLRKEELHQAVQIAIAGTQESEPHLIMGKQTPVTIGNQPGIAIDITGRFLRFPWEHQGKLYFTIADSYFFAIIQADPVGKDSGIQSVLDQVLPAIQFEQDTHRQDRYRRDAKDVVQQHMEAVVSVLAYNDAGEGGTGSGFFIRSDGYLLTNHHVVWDAENGQYHTNFEISWDSSLNRPPLKAELIGAVSRAGRGTGADIVGVDIALLKVNGADFATVELTPAEHVQLGDAVVTMGFPKRGLFDSLNTFVTQGVVTRFNRNGLGQLDSIFIDAKITHGNSGGPCFSLETGGVIGLNSFGYDIGGFDNDMVGYNGVIPIDIVLHEFPQITTYPPAEESTMSARDHYCIGLQFGDQGNYSAAVMEYEKAISLNPRFAQAYQKLADAYYETGQTEKALSYLNHALKLDPSLCDCWYTAAYITYSDDAVDKALDYVNRYIECSNADWSGYLLRSYIRKAAGDPEGALADAKLADKQSNHSQINPVMQAVTTLYDLGRYEEGMQIIEDARKRFPSSSNLNMGEAKYYMYTDQQDKAVPLLVKLHDEFPDDPYYIEQAGSCLYELKNYEQAARAYQAAIAIHEQLHSVPADTTYLNMGRMLMGTLDQPEYAVVLLNEFLESDPDKEPAVKALLVLEEIMKRAEAPSAVLGAHRKLIRELNPEAGRTFSRAGNPDDAPLEKAHLLALVSAGYSSRVLQLFVQISGLAFRLETESDVRDMLNQGVPPNVIDTILEVSASSRPVVDGSPPSSITGRYVGFPDQEKQFRFELTLNVDQTFSSRLSGPEIQNADEGIWRVENGMITLDGSLGTDTVSYRLESNKLYIDIPNMGWCEFTKLE